MSLPQPKQERKNFSMMPDLINESELDVYEYRLYGHYKYVCRENRTCDESVRQIAAKTGMSVTSVLKARKGLAAKNLITIISGNKSTRETDQVKMVDVWETNNKLQTVRVVEQSPSEPFHEANDTVPVVEQGVRVVELDCSRGGTPLESINTQDLIQRENTQDARATEPEKVNPENLNFDNYLSLLFDYRRKKLGVIQLRNEAAEFSEVAWLFDNGFTTAEVIRCYESLSAETWRTAAVTFHTVTKQIADWKIKNRSNTPEPRKPGAENFYEFLMRTEREAARSKQVEVSH